MKNKDFFLKAAQHFKPAPPDGYKADASPSYNWEDDKQPLILPDSHGYVAIHKLLIPNWISQMADIAIKAGYATPAQKTELVRGMMDATGYNEHGNKKEFKLGDISFRYRLKSAGTVDEKISEAALKKKPKTLEDIGDYLAAKWVGRNLSDVVRLREASRIEGMGMTSCKCEYSHPSKEGFRSHKGHHEVEALIDPKKIPTSYRRNIVSQSSMENGLVPLAIKGELMIVDQASESIEAFTHSLKNAERELSKASALFIGDFSKASEGTSRNKGDSNALSKLKILAAEIETLRTYCNDSVHFAQGSDALTFEGKERGIPEQPHSLRSRVKAISLNTRAGIPSTLEKALAPLLGPQARQKGPHAEYVH